MTIAIARDPIYRNRRFKSEIIELCVRWYLTYRLSYRDLVEMMAERGVTISHSTILRWGQRYVPEFERRWGRFARRVHSSWRMDETAVSVRGGAHYLYRAVDKHGKTVDSLLCADRSESAARAYLVGYVLAPARMMHRRFMRLNWGRGRASMDPLPSNPDGLQSVAKNRNRFDRMEWAGAFGDLDTLIPFVVAYIAVAVVKIEPFGAWHPRT